MEFPSRASRRARKPKAGKPTARRQRVGKRGVLRGKLGLAVLLALVGAAVFGYFWPKDARAVMRRVADPIVLSRVESFADDIRFAARESSLDPNLVAAIVYAESSGRVDVVSSANALGLMQLRTDAVHDAAKRLRIAEPNREQLLADGALNLRLGASHFRWILDNEQQDVERSLMAYNAGRTKIRRWARDAGGYEAWYRQQKREGDSPVFAYAQHVLSYAKVFRERGRIDPSAKSRNHENDRLP